MYFDRFDIVTAHYQFYSDFHSGQGSEFYYKLSRILEYFNPSPILSYENMSDNSQYIYQELCDKYGVEFPY